MYLVFPLLIVKPIYFPIFISSSTVLWILSCEFPITTISSAYASRIFPSSGFNVSVRGIFLITLSNAILKSAGDIASPCFSPLFIVNGDDISLFTLTRLLMFVLHSFIMLINLFDITVVIITNVLGKKKKIKDKNKKSASGYRSAIPPTLTFSENLKGAEVKNRRIFTAPNVVDRHKKKNTHHCKINTFITPFRI
ncbi:hypothetical protein AGLY_004872 [Aphis glycines]|uniref:Uncharacterized protein n=1 Tax=Aphis glycines TaxID=307491 RepID=A0A6G0TVL8_APHGL|nr:hypothetical protein AGLY_004872 [Aphis glycines]